VATRYVALLRGINVGGNQRIAMADLRHVLSDLGHADVQTVLQSGNALFTSESTATVTLAREIEAAILDRLGLTVAVIIRTGDELRAVIAANPLAEAVAEPARLHVAFLSADPEPGRFDSLDTVVSASEEMRLGVRALYVWYREGAGTSKLTNAVLERRLGVTATSRNWNTVTKLADLAAR